MKRMLLLGCALCLLGCVALPAMAEGASVRAEIMETYLEGAFSDAKVPAKFSDELGADYDMIGRRDEAGRKYVLAVRKDSAPPITDDMTLEADGGDDSEWGLGVCTNWRIVRCDENGDVVETLYSFSGLENTAIRAFGRYETLLIFPDIAKIPAAIPQAEGIDETVTENGRARIVYRLEHDLLPKHSDRWQIGFYVHSRETYLAGVTYLPTRFYLDLTDAQADLPERIEEAKVAKKTVKEKALVETGVCLDKGDDYYTLYKSSKGADGYFKRSPESGQDTWHFDTDAWTAIMDAARPHMGDAPRSIKLGELTSATLEWPAERSGTYGGETLRAVTITDKKSLGQLRKTLNGAKWEDDFGACPFTAFLTVAESNGETMEIAVATDSCNRCVVGGWQGFAYAGGQKKLLALFGLTGFGG